MSYGIPIARPRTITEGKKLYKRDKYTSNRPPTPSQLEELPLPEPILEGYVEVPEMEEDEPDTELVYSSTQAFKAIEEVPFELNVEMVSFIEYGQGTIDSTGNIGSFSGDGVIIGAGLAGEIFLKNPEKVNSFMTLKFAYSDFETEVESLVEGSEQTVTKSLGYKSIQSFIGGQYNLTRGKGISILGRLSIGGGLSFRSAPFLKTTDEKTGEGTLVVKPVSGAVLMVQDRWSTSEDYQLNTILAIIPFSFSRPSYLAVDGSTVFNFIISDGFYLGIGGTLFYESVTYRSQCSTTAVCSEPTSKSLNTTFMGTMGIHF